MSRKTKKFLSACRILGIDPDAPHDFPVIVYYGKLVEQGWQWNQEDQQWQQTRPGKYVVELEIRVSSYNPDDVLGASDFLASHFHKLGHTVVARQPLLRDSGMWQAYIRVRD